MHFKTKKARKIEIYWKNKSKVQKGSNSHTSARERAEDPLSGFFSNLKRIRPKECDGSTHP